MVMNPVFPVNVKGPRPRRDFLGCKACRHNSKGRSALSLGAVYIGLAFDSSLRGEGKE
jgi:hypothetical protein